MNYRLALFPLRQWNRQFEVDNLGTALQKRGWRVFWDPGCTAWLHGSEIETHRPESLQPPLFRHT